MSTVVLVTGATRGIGRAIAQTLRREGATVITHPASAPTAAPTYRPAKPVYEKATVYMPKAALKRLKLMGIEHDKRVNEFLQEAVDMMLAKYGQPSLKEFESL